MHDRKYMHSLLELYLHQSQSYPPASEEHDLPGRILHYGTYLSQKVTACLSGKSNFIWEKEHDQKPKENPRVWQPTGFNHQQKTKRIFPNHGIHAGIPILSDRCPPRQLAPFVIQPLRLSCRASQRFLPRNGRLASPLHATQRAPNPTRKYSSSHL